MSLQRLTALRCRHLSATTLSSYRSFNFLPQVPTMCVIRWHKHENCDCQFVTQLERCEDYKQKNPDKVSDFIPTVCMKEFENPTKLFRKQLDGILYTTAPSFLIMKANLFPCPHAESVELKELAEVCPFCGDKDVQRQMEQLEGTRISAVKEEMGGKKDEVGREGNEE